MLLILIPLTCAATGGTELSGKITDKADGSSLPGVNVYFPDLKTGTVSDKEGHYVISNLPQAKVMVQVSLLGYKTITAIIDLKTETTRDFQLEESVQEINEVVITGSSHATDIQKSPHPITIVSKEVLLQNASGNIVDALSTQPGISQISTGTGISKPVIRGLSYNRVVLVNDGIRQEGQQWGDEHGIEADEFAVNKIEVLKGPASLSYGSDAIGGVINLLPAPPLPEGSQKGSLLATYQTNNGQAGYTGNLAGNRKGFIYDLRYSGKQAHDYKNRYDGYVYGTGFKENTFSGTIGMNRPWGYSHLLLSSYHLQPEIAEGERDSASGKFTREVVLNDSSSMPKQVDYTEFRSYDLSMPHQNVHHHKAVLNNSFIIKNGILKAILGFQQNRRQEFADIFNPGEYELYLLLNTFNYDLRYLSAEFKGWRFSTGINGMLQASKNKGIEFLIPDYALWDAGLFATAQKTFGRLELSGGLRFDLRNMQFYALWLDSTGAVVSANSNGAMPKFNDFDCRYANFSGSAGMSYEINKYLVGKANIARGFRAPNASELGANGEHEGSMRYEKGMQLLKAETSLQADFSIGWNTEHFSGEISTFINSINNYIYIHKLHAVSGGDSLTADDVPVFSFAQGNALLKGLEVSTDLHPHPYHWLHFENSFSYVRGQLQANGHTNNLPLVPPAKISSGLRADIDKAGRSLRKAYLKAGVDYYFAQNNFYAAYHTETATPSYLLINIGLGTEWTRNDKPVCSVYLSANNLTDVAYQSHLSRLKYAGINNLTGRNGIYNMGRNFSIKLLIPIVAH